MIPHRIQLRRTAGWRLPEGAVVVSRRPWGNPYSAMECGSRYPSLTIEQVRGFVVNQFRYDLRAQHPDYPSEAAIRAELAGKILACWCPLEDDRGNRMPCHGDVLLAIANPGWKP